MPSKTDVPPHAIPRKQQAHGFTPFSAIITCNDRMYEIFSYLERIAGSDLTVLVQGETGVGKELIVQSLHRASGLSGPLIAINVAGIDGTLFSDTLFGHVRGAYSGADTLRQGLVAEAKGGTLFLDEIGDLSQESQVKLLRLLQEKLYYPLGADAPRKSETRVVCATNIDLKMKVAQGQFRADLYYRLTAHHVLIPPLRERLEDIPLLIRHFVAESAQSMNRLVPEITPGFMECFKTWPFPGNIRELQALVHDAIACHHGGPLTVDHLPTKLKNEVQPEPSSGIVVRDENNNLFHAIVGPLPTFKEVERQLMAEALRRSHGDQGVAAAMLGLSRTALNRRIQLEKNKKDKKKPNHS
ncbi:MAG: sigma-54-dependent Fis family transcriptional regulator [Magnetococcales bacterium]|nr:sigma-54-dependent Fis family transcriptional regulator [Magnetococcales bacterium]